MSCEKNEMNKKRPGLAHLLKNEWTQLWLSWLSDPFLYQSSAVQIKYESIIYQGNQKPSPMVIWVGDLRFECQIGKLFFMRNSFLKI